MIGPIKKKRDISLASACLIRVAGDFLKHLAVLRLVLECPDELAFIFGVPLIFHGIFAR